ncbi:hypothetical protein N9B57_02960 [Verrucomicrobia bacterium]|nr:hypothetical protein [bacterium]MDA7866875.1 hypothetical protein [Verrucomicrobiota bacterium]
MACGPLFSTRLLTQGTKALLTAPLSIFTQSLSQINTTTRVPKAAPPKTTRSDQTSTASLKDLRSALEKSRFEKEIQERIYRDFERERNKITRYLAEMLTWTQQRRWNPALPVPVFPTIQPVQDLLTEFHYYFSGAVAYHKGDFSLASDHWKELLKLPPEKRKYRSTWATYMLGKLAMESTPEMANERFKNTRILVKKGFKDSLGLASSSLGWEARTHLKQGNFERALELYLDQHHGGVPSATASIRKVIQTLFEQTDFPLDSMAINVRTRQVIGSYFVSPHFSAERMNSREILARWNKVLETNQVSDPVLAEAMVLSLYRLGQYEAARRWTKRASPESLMSRWILAKLELREGHTEQAIEIYSSLVRQLLLADEQDRFPRFFIDRGEYGLFRSPVQSQIQGENGLIQLSQQDYAQALHSLMHSGSWLDAAHVAERVLTIGELKKYVDQNWPANERKEPPPYQTYSHELSKESLRAKIRSLLGRRLLRIHRWQESISYLNQPYQSQARRVGTSIDFGRQLTNVKKDRAQALWTAALILRYDGIELLATEAEPDWQIYGANFQRSPLSKARLDTKRWPEMAPSQNERHRIEQSSLAIPKRFHYRYVAAELAREAATLMPNETPETARILCQAGTWLKITDPKAADRFYKALVSRCGKTLIGQRATELGWFPEIGKNGEMISSKG